MMWDPSLRRLPYTLKVMKLGRKSISNSRSTRNLVSGYPRYGPGLRCCPLAIQVSPRASHWRNIVKQSPTFPFAIYYTRLQLVRRNVTGVTSSYTATLTLPMSTYNFPCGCSNPHIENIYFSEGCIFPAHFKLTSAALEHPPSPYRSTDTCYEVPFSPAFRESANPLKRRKKGLSLTDNKTYRRKVGAKYSPQAATCSSSLRNLAGDESDQE